MITVNITAPYAGMHVRDIKDQTVERDKWSTAFEINGHGDILAITVASKTPLEKMPAKFDMIGYVDFFGRFDNPIPIDNIGYWLRDGEYVPPVPEARYKVLKETIADLLQVLDVTADALDEAIDQSKKKPIFLTRPLDNARRLLVWHDFGDEHLHGHRSYRIGDVIQYQVHGGSAGQCTFQNCNSVMCDGDWVLIDRVADKLFCCRECVDKFYDDANSGSV